MPSSDGESLFWVGEKASREFRPAGEALRPLSLPLLLLLVFRFTLSGAMSVFGVKTGKAEICGQIRILNCEIETKGTL